MRESNFRNVFLAHIKHSKNILFRLFIFVIKLPKLFQQNASKTYFQERFKS